MSGDVSLAEYVDLEQLLADGATDAEVAVAVEEIEAEADWHELGFGVTD